MAVWCQEEAGPYQTQPSLSSSWASQAHPVQPPHADVRTGTAKLLTRFRPATGQVRLTGVTSCPNAVLHAWRKAEVSALLETVPEPPVVEADPLAQHPHQHTPWTRWQEGLPVKITLPAQLPPLRALLVWDNLKGHHTPELTPELMLWLLAHGVMVLFTPLSGRWRNMAESIQRRLGRRALAGQHPTAPQPIIDWWEATARVWNAAPTPFVWGGKRAARRVRARERRHALAGSGACTARSLRRPTYGGIQRQ
jgi:hypothetical protein